MHTRLPVCTLLLAQLLALFLASPGVRAATPEDQAQIVKVFVEQVPFLKKRFDGSSNLTTAHPIVLMVTAESAFLKDLQLNDPAIIVMPQAEVVSAQLASFASLSGLTVNGDHAFVRYDIPSSDRAGEMRFKKTKGKWEKTSRNESRSLASARVLYGKLYEDTACRDGSEMAYRWNYLLSQRATVYVGNCPGKTFPDVMVYRQQQRASEK